MSPLIWIDGKIVKDGNSPFSSFSFHFGMACFDSIMCIDKFLFRPNSHLNRLMNCCRILKIMPRFSLYYLKKEIKRLLRINRYSSSYIRITVFGKKHFTKLKGTSKGSCVIECLKINKFLFLRKMRKGVKICISSVRNVQPEFLYPLKVSGKYLIFLSALQEAWKRGFDDAILLNDKGYITETATSNIFFIKDEKLYTPPKYFSIDGITKNSVIIIAQKLGYKVKERKIKYNFIDKMEGGFITNTLEGIRPVLQIENKSFGISNVIRKIQKTFIDILLRRNRELNWLEAI